MLSMGLCLAKKFPGRKVLFQRGVHRFSNCKSRPTSNKNESNDEELKEDEQVLGKKSRGAGYMRQLLPPRVRKEKKRRSITSSQVYL